MRGAPPVHLVCGRDALAVIATAGLAGLAAGSLAGWLGWHAGGSPVVVFPFVLMVALAAAGLGAWRVAAAGVRRLGWDGRLWTLDGAPVRVAVMVDLGGWMLLRAHGDGRRAWLPLHLSRTGAPAHLARAALLAHGGAPADGADGGGLGLHG